MANLTSKINLSKLIHALQENAKTGETMIIIPIKANHLFLSEKNNVFLDIHIGRMKKVKDRYHNLG